MLIFLWLCSCMPVFCVLKPPVFRSPYSGPTPNSPSIYQTSSIGEFPNPGTRYNSILWKSRKDSHQYLFAGRGYAETNTLGYLDDIWRFDHRTLRWVWEGVGSRLVDTYGKVMVKNIYKEGNRPGGREGGCSWLKEDTNEAIIFGGEGCTTTDYAVQGLLNDIWGYSMERKLWAFLGGKQKSNSKGSSSIDMVPGARRNMACFANNSMYGYIFGGFGYSFSDSMGFLNDLYEINLSTRVFRRIIPSVDEPAVNQVGRGYERYFSRTNLPGSRCCTSVWFGVNQFFIFGGLGYGSEIGEMGYLSDLWIFDSESTFFKYLSGYRRTNYALQKPERQGVFDVSYFPPGLAFPSIFETREEINESTIIETDSLNKHYLYVFGGLMLSKRSSDLWVYDYSINQWGYFDGEETKDIPSSRSNSMILSSKNRVVIFGGKSESGDLLGDIWSIDLNDVSVSCFGVSWLNSNVCSSHGTCVDLDKCFCDFGYDDVQCDKSICYGEYREGLVCHGHGKCIDIDTCECSAGYGTPELLKKKDCHLAICYNLWETDPKVCGGHGICTYPSNCVCENGYDGKECLHYRCFGVSKESGQVCSGHGSCGRPDQCQCWPPFYGMACEVTQCFGIESNVTDLVCSGHGMCSFEDLCNCYYGYSGLTCDEWSCFGIDHNETSPAIPVCNSHGLCVGNDICLCTDFYSGPDCSSYYCFGVSHAHPSVCGGEGKCDKPNSCSCDIPHFGKICEEHIEDAIFLSPSVVRIPYRLPFSLVSSFPPTFSCDVVIEDKRFVLGWPGYCAWRFESPENVVSLDIHVGENATVKLYDYVWVRLRSAKNRTIRVQVTRVYQLPKNTDEESLVGILIVLASLFVVLSYVCVLLICAFFFRQLISIYRRRNLALGILGDHNIPLLFLNTNNDGDQPIKDRSPRKDGDHGYLNNNDYDDDNNNGFGYRRISGISSASSDGSETSDIEFFSSGTSTSSASAMSSRMIIPQLQVRKDLFKIKAKDVKLIELIGHGGARSCVFKARLRGKLIAAKFFKISQCEPNSIDVADFESELMFMTSLSHPNIVSFLGCSLDPPRIGFISEYCIHNDLRTYYYKCKENRLRFFSWFQKIRIMVEIASAVEYLHERKVIHRDLKSDNVLLTGKKRITAKIGDFGISKLIDRNLQKRMTQHVGTSFYMAPEVTKGLDYDFKIDVYSFSIIMFELICENFDPYSNNNGKIKRRGGDVMNNNDNNLSMIRGVEWRVAHDPDYRPIFPEEDLVNEKMAFVSLVKQCWNDDPDLRPTIKTVRRKLMSEMKNYEEEDSEDG